MRHSERRAGGLPRSKRGSGRASSSRRRVIRRSRIPKRSHAFPNVHKWILHNFSKATLTFALFLFSVPRAGTRTSKRTHLTAATRSFRDFSAIVPPVSADMLTTPVAQRRGTPKKETNSVCRNDPGGPRLHYEGVTKKEHRCSRQTRSPSILSYARQQTATRRKGADGAPPAGVRRTRRRTRPNERATTKRRRPVLRAFSTRADAMTDNWVAKLHASAYKLAGTVLSK